MWLKLLFALTYVILLFVFSRIVNVAVRSGLTSFFIPTNSPINSFHPSNMAVREMKKILDQRGIPYESLIEKKELRQMIQASGQVTYEEIDELSNDDDGTVASSTTGTSSSNQVTTLPLPSTTHITSGGHFYEMVEDTKDSAWLILVLPFISSIAGAFTHSSTDWWTIVNKVSKFGIRVAVFDCTNDVSFCDHRNWKSPRLILALPKNHEKAKSDVILKQYLLSYTVPPSLVLRWIHSELASRVTIIKSLSDLQRNWLAKSSSSSSSSSSSTSSSGTSTSFDTRKTAAAADDDTTNVTQDGKSITNVIWFSSVSKAPLTLSGLAIKFNGRANIAMIQVDTDSISKLQAILPGVNISSLVVTLANGSYYICHSCTTFSQMNLILKTLLPDMNDVFSLSLYLINISVLIHFFWLKCSKFWRHVTFWLMEVVKVNCLLFLTWLAILALYRFPSFKCFIESLNLVTQLVSSSCLGHLLRQNFNAFTSLPFATLAVASCGCFFGWLRRYRLSSFNSNYTAYDDDQLFRDWAPLESTILSYILFRPMNSVSGVRSNLPSATNFEEGMELLIERLAVPNLWLQADLVSNEYIKDLPLWLHPGNNTSDESDSDENYTTGTESLDESTFKCSNTNCSSPSSSSSTATANGNTATELNKVKPCSSSCNLNINCTSSHDQGKSSSSKYSSESLASNSSANGSTANRNLNAVTNRTPATNGSSFTNFSSSSSSTSSSSPSSSSSSSSSSSTTTATTSNNDASTSRQSNYPSGGNNNSSNNEKVRKRRQPNSMVPPGEIFSRRFFSNFHPRTFSSTLPSSDALVIQLNGATIYRIE